MSYTKKTRTTRVERAMHQAKEACAVPDKLRATQTQGEHARASKIIPRVHMVGFARRAPRGALCASRQEAERHAGQITRCTPLIGGARPQSHMDEKGSS